MAKAFTKEDYHQQGVQTFKAGGTLVGRFGAGTAKTWQQRAFLAGWQEARDSSARVPVPIKALPKESKLHVVPIRPALMLAVNSVFRLPIVVIKHLDDLSYRYQFAIKERHATRYRASARRVIDRWTKRAERAASRS